MAKRALFAANIYGRTQEFNSPDSGRESATFDAELERIHREKERTALHHAVLCDDVFKLNKLLDEKADPNAQVKMLNVDIFVGSL